MCTSGHSKPLKPKPLPLPPAAPSATGTPGDIAVGTNTNQQIPAGAVAEMWHVPVSANYKPTGERISGSFNYTDEELPVGQTPAHVDPIYTKNHGALTGIPLFKNTQNDYLQLAPITGDQRSGSSPTVDAGSLRHDLDKPYIVGPLPGPAGR